VSDTHGARAAAKNALRSHVKQSNTGKSACVNGPRYVSGAGGRAQSLAPHFDSCVKFKCRGPLPVFCLPLITVVEPPRTLQCAARARARARARADRRLVKGGGGGRMPTAAGKGNILKINGVFTMHVRAFIWSKSLQPWLRCTKVRRASIERALCEFLWLVDALKPIDRGVSCPK